MKAVLRSFSVLLGLGGVLIGVDQLFFQILGEARPLVTLFWFLWGAMFLVYGILGKEPKQLIHAVLRKSTKHSEGEP